RGMRYSDETASQNLPSKLDSFLPRNELNYAGQTSMKLSFNDFALDFPCENWLTIRELLFKLREVHQHVRIFWTTRVARNLCFCVCLKKDDAPGLQATLDLRIQPVPYLTRKVRR